MVKKLLAQMAYQVRRLIESVTRAGSTGRDEQFRIIADLRERFERTGQPIPSIDGKQKELLGGPDGPMYRAGQVLADGPADVLGHDLSSYASASVTPHGIYDVGGNRLHLNLTAGSDCAAFAGANLRWYWDHIGSGHWPDADQLLLLCDCGGSNGYRSLPVKRQLQTLAERSALTVRVAHLPVHCSKDNPIERRAFCHVERQLGGSCSASIDELAGRCAETRIRTGLETTTHVLEGSYRPQRRDRRKTAPPSPAITHRALPDYRFEPSCDAD